MSRNILHDNNLYILVDILSGGNNGVNQCREAQWCRKKVLGSNLLLCRLCMFSRELLCVFRFPHTVQSNAGLSTVCVCLHRSNSTGTGIAVSPSLFFPFPRMYSCEGVAIPTSASTDIQSDSAFVMSPEGPLNCRNMKKMLAIAGVLSLLAVGALSY